MGLVLDYVKTYSGLSRRKPGARGFTSGQGRPRVLGNNRAGARRQSPISGGGASGGRASGRGRGSRATAKNKGLFENELDRYKYGSAGKVRRAGLFGKKPKSPTTSNARRARLAVSSGTAPNYIQLSTGKLAGSRRQHR